MITCDIHGEQTEHTIGDKHFCSVCVQEVFGVRIKEYELMI